MNYLIQLNNIVLELQRIILDMDIHQHSQLPSQVGTSPKKYNYFPDRVDSYYVQIWTRCDDDLPQEYIYKATIKKRFDTSDYFSTNPEYFDAAGCISRDTAITVLDTWNEKSSKWNRKSHRRVWYRYYLI